MAMLRKQTPAPGYLLTGFLVLAIIVLGVILFL